MAILLAVNLRTVLLVRFASSLAAVLHLKSLNLSATKKCNGSAHDEATIKRDRLLHEAVPSSLSTNKFRDDLLILLLQSLQNADDFLVLGLDLPSLPASFSVRRCSQGKLV